jgi:hypothetical protein
MARPAEPLDPVALSAWQDACIEEIHDRNINWGLSCLLGTHSGFRKRILSHYTDDWRVSAANGEKFSLPEGQVACTVEEDGCCHCHMERTSGDNGFFQVKKHTAGVGREVPVWEEWIDYHEGESRPTELPEWLNHYFRTNDSFGFSPDQLQLAVKQVAMRRHDTIAENHEGEVERWLSNRKAVVPDIKPHDLRATWATQCLRAGVDETQLMDWAGWKTRKMIDRYRSKLNDPSGENTDAYARGRGNEGMSAHEKLAKLRELGIIDDDENLSADELAEAVELLS